MFETGHSTGKSYTRSAFLSFYRQRIHFFTLLVLAVNYFEIQIKHCKNAKIPSLFGFCLFLYFVFLFRQKETNQNVKDRRILFVSQNIKSDLSLICSNKTLFLFSLSQTAVIAEIGDGGVFNYQRGFYCSACPATVVSFAKTEGRQ